MRRRAPRGGRRERLPGDDAGQHRPRPRTPQPRGPPVDPGYACVAQAARGAVVSELDLDAIEAGARAALEEVPDPRARGWRPGASEKHVYVPYAEALEGPNGERVLLRDRILLGDTEGSLRMNPHFAHE